MMKYTIPESTNLSFWIANVGGLISQLMRRVVNDLKHILLSMRPEQWVKNIFVFAGIVFSRKLLQPDILLGVCTGFFLFCLASSGIYVFNDLKDLTRDREHPEKSKRPLAAGLLDERVAWAASILLAVLPLTAAWMLDLSFFLILAVYLALNILYSIKIKHMVILDVMCIAGGFVLRVLAGTTLAGVEASEWMIACTAAIALFLGFSKRRQEITVRARGADHHRKVLSDYSIPFIDQMIGIASAATILFYVLYAISPDTIERFGSRNLMLTIPFVLYGIYRYLYLMHRREFNGNPGSTIFKDVPLVVNGMIWLLFVLFIVYRS